MCQLKAGGMQELHRCKPNLVCYGLVERGFAPAGTQHATLPVSRLSSLMIEFVSPSAHSTLAVVGPLYSLVLACAIAGAPASSK
jgi:hypothetical protein